MKEKKTTKIEIPEITRVEGHEAVYVEIEDGKVSDVKVDVFEGTRFFEKLVVGNHFNQMPHITSRVCAICSTGHVLAAIRAVEKMYNFQANRTTELLREAMHLGMIIESNSTHIFALALPDFLGFEDVYDFATKHANEFGMWTDLRNFGANIQTTLGGRPFHPINLHAGGFSKHPERKKLEEIRSSLDEIEKKTIKTAELLLEFSPPVRRTSEPVFVALFSDDDHYSYFGNSIKASNGFSASVDQYREYLKEETVKYSHSKRSTMDGKPIMVGSLARLSLYSDRLQEPAKDIFNQSQLSKGDFNTIWNNLGQAIEMIEATSRLRFILNELISNYDDWYRLKPLCELDPLEEPKTEVGTVECPRGTLYHEFTVDSKGMISKANMITPSAQNTYQIEKDIHEVVTSSLEDTDAGSLDDTLSKNLETLVRAYDPCNTCATHMVSVKFKNS